MLTIFALAVPLALIWMTITDQVSPGSFFVGLVVGLAVTTLLGAQSVQIQPSKLLDQTWGLVVYTVILCRDIWLSTFDVTRRVLNPKLPLNPGVLRVPTMDENKSEVIAAFSAHGITITPGELVVDFREQDIMFVHCLDIGASSQSAPGAQIKRLRMLNRILGRSAVLPEDAS